MEKLSLDIDDYDLNDLLKLFNLTIDFTNDDIKQAKKIVLMTHPDKSKLDKKYFLFFSKAFKIVYKLAEHKNHRNQSTNYIIDESNENDEYVEKIKKMDNFNKWFNDTFEKLKLSEKGEGYGEWFSTNNDVNQEECKNLRDMNERIDAKKASMRSLIKHNEINDYQNISQGANLLNNECENYSSDIFSKLRYDDLKQAHTETVVPVSEDDYNNVKKYNTINALKQDRGRQIEIINNEQSNQILSDKRKSEVRSSVNRSYMLARQEEENQKKKDLWWSELKQIKN